ncbi:MAG: hypothetical protein GKR91_01805 [Pseudomonadales bacterium]|nr:hypothetical protein [Pseudomonadales bacterium]
MKKLKATTFRLVITSFLLGLSGFGFLTAPAGLAGAEVASSTVKAADVSLETSKEAAIFVRDKSVQGYEISSEFVQEKSIQGYEYTADLFGDLTIYLRKVARRGDIAEDIELDPEETSTTIVVQQTANEDEP